MNSVDEEMNDILMHIGMPKRSGRYPWGSGDNPYQHGRDLLGRIEELKKQGWTETPENIKKEFGLTTTQYRTEKAIAKDERRALDVARAKSLKEDGLGATEIGREMGIPESTVRSLLNPTSESRMQQARKTADFIKKQVDEKGIIDVGSDVNLELSAAFGLNISKEKFNQALYLLEREGYTTQSFRVEQATNKGQWTTIKAICPPGTDQKDLYAFSKGEKNISTLTEYISRDGGETFEKKFTYPSSLDRKRLYIRYPDEGGDSKDGIIELRRGVDDLSLGNSHYSQVRILVDGKSYLKGMAVYSDDMPKGVDVVFNTSKPRGSDEWGVVMKKIKEDPDNPFGSVIKDAEQGGQYWYTDKKTGERKLGLINKRADEGDWTDWKDALPSQFLSKQSLKLAKKQLGLATADKNAEFDEICSLTNPTIKKHLLSKFADECDSAAVHLQAAALPGQKYHVIIPINSLKDTEVYAPGYEPGTKLALIRYPHGGTFEIPILTVNNKNSTAKKVIGTDVIDAVGINKKIADQLSGADFDGDTVMCIPTHDKSGKVNIRSRKPLKDLEGFDPRTSYGADEVKEDANGTAHYYRNGKEYRRMRNTGTQMGIISNLITDMTLQGADDDELARAVKHSMVVIDAEKHKLDYKQSEMDNNIAALKKKYQTGGASTLISRSKGDIQVDKRQGTPNINKKGKEWYDPTKPEGSLIYKTADDVEYTVAKISKKAPHGETNSTVRISDKGRRYIQPDGSDEWTPLDGKSDLPDGSRVKASIIIKRKHQPSTKMAETDDARTLISAADTPMERAYADYANSMKSLANKARLEVINTGKIAYSTSAKDTYRKEVDSLMAKLNDARLNAPRERYAQYLANVEVSSKKISNPDMKKEDEKKASQQALSKYRTLVGSIARRDRSINIEDREWEAIQAGAISENKLKQILNNSDISSLRARATPRSSTTLSQSKINSIKAYTASNYTLQEIAQKLGVSASVVSKYLKGTN